MLFPTASDGSTRGTGIAAAKKGLFQTLKDEYRKGVEAGLGTDSEPEHVDVEPAAGPTLEEIKTLVDGARASKTWIKPVYDALGDLQAIDLARLEQVEDFKALAEAIGAAQYVVEALHKALVAATDGDVAEPYLQPPAEDRDDREANDGERERSAQAVRGEACTCGAAVKVGAQFCGSCGKKVSATPSTRFCAKCGAQLAAGSSFCGGCGTPRG